MMPPLITPHSHNQDQGPSTAADTARQPVANHCLRRWVSGGGFPPGHRLSVTAFAGLLDPAA